MELKTEIMTQKDTIIYRMNGTINKGGLQDPIRGTTDKIPTLLWVTREILTKRLT